MGLTIPNYASATYADQAEPDSVDFQILGDGTCGVLSGCAVTYNGTSSVNITAGAVVTNNNYYEIAATSNFSLSALDSNNSTANPWFELIVITSSGVVAKRNGLGSANPVYPTLTANDVVLAAVYHTAGGSINANSLVDKRLMVRSNTTINSTTTPNASYSKNGDIWVDTDLGTATGQLPVYIRVGNNWLNVARYTAVSTASASNTLVYRDASSNFAGNVITAASFSGNGANVTGVNASTLNGASASVGGVDNDVAYQNTIVKRSGNNSISSYIIAGNTASFATQVAAPYVSTDFIIPNNVGVVNLGSNSTTQVVYQGILKDPYADSTIDTQALGQGFYLNQTPTILMARDITFSAMLRLNNTSSGTSSRAIIDFRYQGTVKGSIGVSSTATAFNTSSDYRLKENIETIESAVSLIKNLNPVTFSWKDLPNEQRVAGFIAHELQEVVPNAVTGEKDAVNQDGSPDYQGVDLSKLVPYLTAAIQELTARLEALEASK